jgi:hypothetical protein
LEFSKELLEGKVIYGRVGLSAQQTMWLEAMECKKVLPGE